MSQLCIPPNRAMLTSMLLKLLHKKLQGRNISKLILRGQYHPDTKTRHRYHKKRPVSPASINDEHWEILNKILANWVQQIKSLNHQWLRLHTSTAGSMDSISGQGIKVWYASWHSQNKQANKHYEDPTPWSTGIYPRDASVLQYM